MIWSVTLAAIVVLAAGRAQPWTLVWATGVALVAGVPSWWVFASVIGLGLAAAAVLRPPWRPLLMPASVGALATLLHLPSLRFFGAEGLIAAVAIAPLLVSALVHSSPRTRRNTMTVGGVVAIALVVISVIVGVVVFSAAPEIDAGATAAQRGLSEARAGATDEASASFDAAAESFGAASSTLSTPLLFGAAFVPVLAQNVQAVRTATESGESLSAAAREASVVASSSPDLLRDGQVDLSWLRSTAPVVRASSDSLNSALASLTSVRSPWLLGPLATPLDTLLGDLESSVLSAQTGADLLGVAPDLLGSPAPKRYLVLATNLAEARYHGGFVGGYVELEVTDGQFAVVASGKASDLTPFLELANIDVGDAAYRERYGGYAPERYFQNATATPDGAINAEVAAEVYGELTQRAIDGVVIIDPAGLAALLRITGPVVVDGVAEPITADGVEAFLHRDQYLLYDERNPERSEVLGRVAEAVVEALTSRTLPGPRALSQALAPAFDRGNIQFWFRDPQVQDVIERTPTAGRFVPELGHDLLSVRSANLNANKIDGFARRDVEYRVEFDPGTGSVTSEVEVTVVNDAPSSGLPDYLIGVDSRPPGTNRMLLTIWTPQSLESATVDGSPVEVSNQPDAGLASYTVRIAVPPGATQTVRFALSGRIDVGSTYRLVTYQQPAVTPDVVDVAVSATDGAQPQPSVGFTVVDGVASGQLPPTWRTDTAVTFGSGS